MILNPNRLSPRRCTPSEELRGLLMQQGERELAAQVLSLRIVDRCRRGDDFCAMFYVLINGN